MNKTFIKYIALFLILTICTFSLSGCLNENNIDHLAYVVALGLDVSETNNLKLTFQLSTPGSISSAQGSSSQSDTFVINTIECSSIDSGINLLNSYMSKRINLAHCKVFVFSEELASKGISKEIYALMNFVEVRPDSVVIVSKCSSEYFLNNSKPVLEKLAARYYEIAPTSSEYTGYTENITLSTFFATLNDPTRQCTAILGDVNTSNLKDTNSSLTDSEKDSNYVAGQTPVHGTTNIENMGLAVFIDDKLVGELTSIETLCHLIITNKLETSTITIPDPFDNGDVLDLSLEQKKKTKNNVTIVNGSPYIECDISLTSTIYSIDKNAEFLNEENLKIIEKYASNYLTNKMQQYLYKTSKSLNSDIDGFGKYFAKTVLFTEDFQEYDWLSNYQNSFFDVNVDVSVTSGHLLMET